MNSCTVTEQADRQCIRFVNQIKKKSPKVWSIVTGCFAEVGKSKLSQNSNIEQIVGNKEKSSLKLIVAKRYGIEVGEVLSQEIYWGQLPTQKGKTRAFLKIQEGCNDFCTYCIIPMARGKSRSIRLGHILEEITRLSLIGIQEVILTGTNIADYGKDLNSSLKDLVEAILLHTPIARLRLSSLDPSEVTDRLLNLISPTSRLMPHFHISLQSPISQVLR